jgi:hypothetical protein
MRGSSFGSRVSPASAARCESSAFFIDRGA